jgi:phage terminase large subunit-like protein
MNTEQTTVCGLDENQIALLKKKHGFLVVVEIKQGDSVLNAIFKEPTFEVLEATGAIGKNSEIKGTVALYENCIIKADDEINNRDFAKLKALEGLAQHMNSFSVGVKNL